MGFTLHKLASMAFAVLSTVDANALVVRTGPPKQPSCVDFTPFVYAGCFKDDTSPRTLLYSSGLDSKTMTVEKCVAFCKGNEYRYAGLEYYGECYCGASVNALQVEEKNCNFPCNGNKTESCGGGKIISIYQDPTFPVVSTKTISDYMSMGCYSEGPNGRTLGWRQDDVNPATLSVEKCLSSCLSGGYAFAGVEFGRECYCGVVLGNGTVPLNASECNLRCTGNNAQFCGGHSKLNLYVARNVESSEPCEEGGPISSSSSILPTSTSTSMTTAFSSTLTPSSITSLSSTTESPSLTSSGVLSSSFLSTESLGLTSSTTPVDTSLTTSSSDPSSSLNVLPTPFITTSSTTTDSTSSTEEPSSSTTISSFGVISIPSENPTSSVISTSSDTPSSSGILPTPITTTSSSTTESSSGTETTSSTEESSLSTTTSSFESRSTSSDIPSSSGVLPTPITTTEGSSSSTGSSTSSTTTTSSLEFSHTSSETSSSSTIFTSSVPFTTLSSPSNSPTPKVPSSTPSVIYTPTSTSTSTSKTIEICTSYYTVYPPLPSPTCAYKLGKWCAKPIPEFNDTFTCLKSFASCVTQLSACFSKAGYPELLKCNQFNEYCSQIADFCDDFCPGKQCTLSSCKQEIPPYGVPTAPTQLPGVIFSSLYTCPPFTLLTPSLILPTPFTTTIANKPTSTPAIPTYPNICTQPNNPAKGYGTYSPVGGIPLPNLSCNNDYFDYKPGHPFKLYTSSDTYVCPSYEQSGAGGPSQGCKDACDEQFKLCNTGYAEPYKGYKKSKRGSSDNYTSACQKCQNQRNDCYLANEGVSGGQKCGAFNKGY